MKKNILQLDFNDIRKRIEDYKSQFKAKKWAELLGVAESVISNFHRKKNPRSPSYEYIIAVARITGKPVEWYLYGTQPGEAPSEHRCQFCGDMSDEIKKHCKAIKDIIDSKHPVIVPALLSNLEAFKYSIDRERKQDDDIQKLKIKVRHHEKLLNPGQSTAIGRAAGTGAKQRKR